MGGIRVEYEVGMLIVVFLLVRIGKQIWRDAHTVVQSSKEGGKTSGDGYNSPNLLRSLLIARSEILFHI